MQRTDRWLGFALILLGSAVLWSARAFPDVPGQDVGAGFLPMIVGAGLIACGLGLVARGFRAGPDHESSAVQPSGAEHFGSAFVVIGAIVFYVATADRLGFLLVAPLCLLAVFKAMQVPTVQALLWSIGGTLIVHLVFYKLLRVPLPWGVLRPFY